MKSKIVTKDSVRPQRFGENPLRGQGNHHMYLHYCKYHLYMVREKSLFDVVKASDVPAVGRIG